MKYCLALLLLLSLPATAQEGQEIQQIEQVAPQVDDAYNPNKDIIPPANQIQAEPQPPVPESTPTAAVPAPEVAPAPLEPEMIEGNKAVVQILDKIDARVENVEIEVNKEKEYHSLKIEVTRCIHSPQESKEENLAFMRIWDVGQGDYTNIVFSGWMFSSNPALHSLEHPIYDVVLLKCED